MQFGKRDVPNVTNALCFKKLSILFVLSVTVMHAQLVRVHGHSLRSSCACAFGALHLRFFFCCHPVKLSQAKIVPDPD